MTTTIVSPPTSAEYLAAVASFEAAAPNVSIGIADLFSRWQRVKVAGARSAHDPLASATFGQAIEATLERRANPSPDPFSIVAAIAKAKLHHRHASQLH